MKRDPTLVALDEGVDRSSSRPALPVDRRTSRSSGSSKGSRTAGARSRRRRRTCSSSRAPATRTGRSTSYRRRPRKQRPDRPVVVFSRARRTASSGASSRPARTTSSRCRRAPTEQVAFALQKAVARKQGAPLATGVALAPMICVLGPKGGTGKTLTASTSASPRASRAKVAVVDLDLQFGDVGLALGLRPSARSTTSRVGRLARRGEARGYLAEHASGVRVLMAPTRARPGRRVTTEFLRDGLRAAALDARLRRSWTRRPASRPR